MFAAMGFTLGGFGIITHGQFGGYSAEFLAEYDVPYLQVLFREFWLGIVGGLIGVPERKSTMPVELLMSVSTRASMPSLAAAATRFSGAMVPYLRL